MTWRIVEISLLNLYLRVVIRLRELSCVWEHIKGDMLENEKYDDELRSTVKYNNIVTEGDFKFCLEGINGIRFHPRLVNGNLK